MAKVGFHERALRMWHSDLRLQRLGVETAALWLRLVMMIAEYGDDGIALRMGSRLGFANDIATLLSQTETQLETQIARLVAADLITCDAVGTLGMPVQFLPTRRQIANRINGSKGGRPKTRINAPTQAEMIMGIAGGRDAAAKGNPMETQRQSAPPSLSLADSNQAKASAVDVSDEEFQRIGRAAFEVAFDHAKDMPNWGIARQWVADAMLAGVPADARQDLIVGACQTVTDQMAKRGTKPGHMGAFKKEVGRAIGAYQPVKSVASIAGEREWEAAMQAWTRKGDPSIPMPVLADFIARKQANAA